MNDNELKLYILNKIKDAALKFGITLIEDDFSILGSGVFNSYTFLEFITDLEIYCKHEIDLSQFNPSEYDNIDGLIECINNNLKNE